MNGFIYKGGVPPAIDDEWYDTLPWMRSAVEESIIRADEFTNSTLVQTPTVLVVLKPGDIVERNEDGSLSVFTME